MGLLADDILVASVDKVVFAKTNRPGYDLLG